MCVSGYATRCLAVLLGGLHLILPPKQHLPFLLDATIHVHVRYVWSIVMIFGSHMTRLLTYSLLSATIYLFTHASFKQQGQICTSIYHT